MPRPLRIQLEETATYYVTAHAAAGQMLFPAPEDAQAYRDFLQTYQRQHGFVCRGMVLLPAALHLCLELPSGVALSECIHDIHSRYTKYMAGRYGTHGHLFEGRFKSAVIEPGESVSKLLCFMGTFGRESRLSYSEGIPPVGILPQEADQVRSDLRLGVLGSPEFCERIKSIQQLPGPKLVKETVVHHHSVPALPAWGLLVLETGLLGFLLARVEPGRTQAAWNGSAAIASELHSRGTPQLASAVMADHHLSLNGTAWEVQIVPLYPSQTGAPVRADQVTFSEGQIHSKELAAQGFSRANVTLTLQSDGTLLWETMQNHPQGETVFWRGEWKGEKMHGILSRHAQGGTPQDYMFRATPVAHVEGAL